MGTKLTNLRDSGGYRRYKDDAKDESLKGRGHGSSKTEAHKPSPAKHNKQSGSGKGNEQTKTTRGTSLGRHHT